MVQRRKDSKNRVLRTGESERKAGGYDFRWRDRRGKRHSIYAHTLEELREKEKEVMLDDSRGVKPDARTAKLNERYEVWRDLKRGLKDNTFQNYIYMYEMFVKPDLGQMRISQIRHSDVKRFYNTLYEERGLKVSALVSHILHHAQHGHESR